jgi:hypothetical protein
MEHNYCETKFIDAKDDNETNNFNILITLFNKIYKFSHPKNREYIFSPYDSEFLKSVKIPMNPSFFSTSNDDYFQGGDLFDLDPNGGNECKTYGDIKKVLNLFSLVTEIDVKPALRLVRLYDHTEW